MVTTVGRVFRAIGRGLTWPIRLVREAESDIQGTYPDHHKPSGAQQATQGSVTMGLTGLGSGGLG